MRWRRMVMAILILVAIVGGSFGPGRQAQALGIWTPIAAPPDGIGFDPANLTPLDDGRVLLTRLAQEATPGPMRLSTAIYEPAGNRWVPAPAPEPQAGFAAPVLLRDRRVLVSGGGADDSYQSGNGFITASAQTYDPAAQRWTPVGALAQARAQHTASLLRDGTVLVVGGQTGITSGQHQAVASAERFDPQTGQWSATGALAEPRAGHTATVLLDGRVLVVGGRAGDDPAAPTAQVLSAELYEPEAGRWVAAAAPLRTHGKGHSATLMPDGRVLVAGGDATSGSRSAPLGVAEIYDPAQNSWSLAAPLRWGVNGHSALVLPDGRVLVVGGSGSYTQVYDRTRDLWTLEANPPAYSASAASLRDGRVLLVGANGAAIYNGGPAPEQTCFPETGYCIQGRFLQYWQEHGGLAINGYPLSNEQAEILEDGQAYTVQYFERSRLEYHPEIGDPQYQVLLGQFGRRMLSVAYGEYVSHTGYLEAIKPAAPLDGARYFPETGHNLSGRFRAYWEANGGLSQFGLPLTEERYDGLPTAAGIACCQTQYFERARFEYHPENAGTPFEVLLGQFGRQILIDNAQMSGEFGRLYATETRVRERLGAPRGPQVVVPGAVQPFESGLMVWRGDLKQIFVLVGTQSEGTLAVGTQGYNSEVAWADTWAEGQDPGGGAAPVAGRFLPQRGFGKLWREQGFRNSLGYATTPDEQAYTMTIQQFAAGWLLTTEGPGGRNIYAIYLQATGSHNAYRIGTYERVATR